MAWTGDTGLHRYFTGQDSLIIRCQPHYVLISHHALRKIPVLASRNTKWILDGSNSLAYRKSFADTLGKLGMPCHDLVFKGALEINRSSLPAQK
jgi:hypothetical protein